MCLFHRHHPVSSRGFTLLELLIVLTIISILAAMAFSAYSGVQRNARAAECASNLRQVGTALQLYLNDHRGQYPGTTHDQEWEGSWFNTLDPYIGDSDRVRISPADPHKDERLKLGSSSYVLNDYLAVPTYDEFGRPMEDFSNFNKLRNPVETIAVFVVSDRAKLTTDHPHARRWWNSWDSVLGDIQPDRHRSGQPAEDHTRGKAPYLYADGHVEFIEAADLKKRIDAGENPAYPPAD